MTITYLDYTSILTPTSGGAGARPPGPADPGSGGGGCQCRSPLGYPSTPLGPGEPLHPPAPWEYIHSPFNPRGTGGSLGTLRLLGNTIQATLWGDGRGAPQCPAPWSPSGYGVGPGGGL